MNDSESNDALFCAYTESTAAAATVTHSSGELIRVF